MVLLSGVLVHDLSTVVRGLAPWSHIYIYIYILIYIYFFVEHESA
jgi:hypothetical protein